MKVKDTYDHLQAGGKAPYLDLGKELVDSIDLYGLGVMPKSDLEALIFHCICNAIEDDYAENIQKLDYDLMQMLRISPAKLRSLRVTRSAKFLNDLDWHNAKNQKRIVNALSHVPMGNEDIVNGKVSIVISDPHIQNLIERMVEENKGVLDRAISSRVLVLNAKQFLGIVAAIYGDGAEGGYEETIKAIKAETRDTVGELTKDNIIDEFHNAFKEKAFGKLIELGGKVAMNAVSHRLGLS